MLTELTKFLWQQRAYRGARGRCQRPTNSLSFSRLCLGSLIGPRLTQLVLQVVLVQTLWLQVVNAAEVQQVRAHHDGAHTRVVFDLSQPAAFQVVTSADPKAVVLEVADASVASGFRSNPRELKGSPVNAISSEQLVNGRLRFVLSLRSNVEAKAFALRAIAPKGPRLVLDLYASSELIPPPSSEGVAAVATEAVISSVSPQDAATTNTPPPSLAEINEKIAAPVGGAPVESRTTPAVSAASTANLETLPPAAASATTAASEPVRDNTVSPPTLRPPATSLPNPSPPASGEPASDGQSPKTTAATSPIIAAATSATTTDVAAKASPQIDSDNPPGPQIGSSAEAPAAAVSVPADERAKTNESGTSIAVTTPQRNRRGRDVVVAIDAGHGGQDPGAIGPDGIREKEVVLAIARELRDYLNAEPGFRGVLVRENDRFIPLRGRTARARQLKADLFISIHADAFTNARARGASVYALSERGATSETARWLAERENQSDLMGGVSLDDKDQQLAQVLLDLSMTASLTESLEMGAKILQQLGGVTRLHGRHVEQAGFMVLKSPDIPSVLVETGYISNPTEARLLATPAHRRKLAQAIFHGVKAHVLTRPPSETRFAIDAAEHKNRVASEQNYTVIAGDTLERLARRFNVRDHEIRSRNGMSNDEIKVGQVLVIPGAPGS